MKAMAKKLNSKNGKTSTKENRATYFASSLNSCWNRNETSKLFLRLLYLPGWREGIALANCQTTGAMQTDKEHGLRRSGRSLQLILPESWEGGRGKTVSDATGLAWFLFAHFLIFYWVIDNSSVATWFLFFLCIVAEQIQVKKIPKLCSWKNFILCERMPVAQYLKYNGMGSSSPF